MNNLDLEKVINEVYLIINKNKNYLNDLDTAIGDGDHGTNINRGLKSIIDNKKKWIDLEPKKILNSWAIDLISNVGGASGPIFGTFLMSFASNLNNNNILNFTSFFDAYKNAVIAVKKIGKVEFKDKTMFDILYTIQETIEKNIDENDNNNLLNKLIKNSNHTLEETKKIIAKKGRASYLGERSLNHIDPGSQTIVFILEIICKYIYENSDFSSKS